MVDVKSELAKLEDMQLEVNNRRAALRSDAVKEAQQIIDQFQLQASDFRFKDGETMVRKSRRGSVKPKYRGPKGELWTGRGRSPKWVEQIKANGESIEKYLIEQ